MTKEELTVIVQKVQEKEEGAVSELWEAVHKFVEMKARQYYKLVGEPTNTSYEDLKQVGFFAMMEAVENYRGEALEYTFLTNMNFYLKTSYRKELGIYTSKRDASMFSTSLDKNMEDGEGTGDSFLDLLVDIESETPMRITEDNDFLRYCRGLLDEALKTLPQAEEELLILRYFDEISVTTLAQIYGFQSKQMTSYYISKPLAKLKKGKYAKKLKDALDDFADFHMIENAKHHTGAGSFKQTGLSSVEAMAM